MLREYTSGTQKVVKIPLIDSIYLNILQMLELKFAKIDKRGVQIRSEGLEKFPKINKRGRGDVYKAPKSSRHFLVYTPLDFSLAPSLAESGNNK